MKLKVCLSLFLLVVVALLYGQFLQNPFVFDDMPFFQFDNTGRQPINDYHFVFNQLRSLPYATLAWTKSGFGLAVANFRIGNLLLHTSVVIALFFVLSELFPVVIGSLNKAELKPIWTAFFAALLFAVHPVSTYAAGYLVQRTMLLATLFSLLALLTYLHGTIEKKPFWLWSTVPFYYLAVFSKEHAVMLPAVLLAVTVLLPVNLLTELRKRKALFAALAAVSIMVVLAAKGVLGSAYEPAAIDLLLVDQVKLAYPLSILTQAWLFFKYAFLWAFPNPSWMSIDMREPFAQSLFSIYLLSALFFILWGIVAIWLLFKRGRTGLGGFALLFPWLMFMPEFSSVRIQEVFVLYRSYLWAVGAFCLLPILISKLSYRVATFILVLSAAAMFMMSMERLMIMSDPLFLWDDSEKLVRNRNDLPGAYRIYHNRGTSLISLDMYEQSIPDFQRAIELAPDFPDAHHNLGVAYFATNNMQKAIAEFNIAIEVARKNGNVFVQAEGNLGRAYSKSGEIAKAVVHFTKAIELAKLQRSIDPYPYYLGRADVFQKLGDIDKAQADYQEACTRAKKGCDKLIGNKGSLAK